jgi:hypothetical protein
MMSLAILLLGIVMSLLHSAAMNIVGADVFVRLAAGSVILR